MKKVIFALIVFVYTFSLSAQKQNIPVNAKNAFSKLYPQATNVKWNKEGESKFEASFKNEKISMSVVLDNDGKLIETETTLEVANLPEKILKFVKDNYSDHKISEAAKIVDKDGKITFEAEIAKGKNKKDLIFSEDGQLIKR